MLAQHYPIIGSSSRISWQVSMCARVDTGNENQDRAKENIILLYIIVYRHRSFVMVIIRNIPEHKYFVYIKHVTVTTDSPDLSDSVAELAFSMLTSVTPQMGITIKDPTISRFGESTGSLVRPSLTRSANHSRHSVVI